ncbi:MAG TPA: preprotein translocase subunit SecG [bacterium]|nr:preprotein translocase subunit SecG [bacterium]
MVAFLIVIHVLVSILLIVSILLQSSKGGGLAGMFGGGGAMGGFFGARGAATFLSKVTVWLGIVFGVTSITIALLSAGASTRSRSLVEQVMEEGESSPASMLPTVSEKPPENPLPESVPDGQR